ncbi:RHOMBOID-like protein 12, mitochondrial [Lolium perenne]|uniref:RHOMBOID-like protein 12, mitochondrial n=1 Tax=Lolium perenne TaxID=4522 RepID=UPI0021F5D809|nr:RHOMBOID-like protein 12, mitochondrial [Lolium perenne]
MAIRRRLLRVLRRAIPKPRPPPTPRRRFLHTPSLLDAVAAAPSPSPNLLSRSSGSLPPLSAATVVEEAAPTAAAYLVELAETVLPAAQVVAALLSAWVHWRSTPEGPHGMVLTLVGANVAVHALCRLADPSFKMNHFATSLDNFKSGRLHTLLTSAFTHIHLDHLFKNMSTFYFFGSDIAGMFGPAFLLKLYVSGALTGSAFFLAEMACLAPREEGFGGWKTPMLGASAAVRATVFLEIFLYPKRMLYLHFCIPVPAAIAGAGFIGADLWRVKKGQSGVAGSAHLGGAFVGALVWTKLKGWI